MDYFYYILICIAAISLLIQSYRVVRAIIAAVQLYRTLHPGTGGLLRLFRVRSLIAGASIITAVSVLCSSVVLITFDLATLFLGLLFAYCALTLAHMSLAEIFTVSEKKTMLGNNTHRNAPPPN